MEIYGLRPWSLSGPPLGARMGIYDRSAQGRSGFIVVRLAGQIRPAEVDNLLEFAQARRLRGIEKMLRDLRLPPAKPAIRSVSLDTILQLERQAAATEWRP